MTSPTLTPSESWRRMKAGNDRFIEGVQRHPRQDAERRSQIESAQSPMAALFGCADSRIAAEIIFDKGLGDLFVVRNAGQVISSSVIGSLEYAVEVVGVPLIVVLSHDNCGAVAAAMEQDKPGSTPLPPHIGEITEAIAPAVQRVREAQGLQAGELEDHEAVGREHLRDTVSTLLASSELISDAVAIGKLAVVGANYTLAEGRVSPAVVIGALDE
ncbi:MAG: carbonic anhydrase [Pontimonas sp.]|jgi:carbonic anhydrase|nr:carbonic anhydrase [Pontimonas sp.]